MARWKYVCLLVFLIILTMEILQQKYMLITKENSYEHNMDKLNEENSYQHNKDKLNEENSYQHNKDKLNEENRYQQNMDKLNEENSYQQNMDKLNEENSCQHNMDKLNEENSYQQNMDKLNEENSYQHNMDKLNEENSYQQNMDKLNEENSYQLNMEKLQLSLKEFKGSGIFSNHFQERKDRLIRACQKYAKLGIGLDPTRPKDVLYVPRYNMSICVIQKVGCMFWHRIVAQLQNNDKKMYKEPDYRLEDNLETSFQKSYKIVFIREPYSRLLSGYLDKLFFPNPVYWELGKEIIKEIRRNATRHSLECGHDVTFEELVKYVLRVESSKVKRNDIHFLPVHKHCSFCKQSYDIIGNMETFKDDLLQITLAINATDNMEFLRMAFSNYMLNEINNSAKRFFQKKNNVTACISMHEALHRVWKIWQTRGFISSDHNFNMSPEKCKYIGFSEFTNMAMQAMQNSNETARKSTQYKLKLKMFESLSRTDKLSLRDLFRPEFDMFGYDPMPSFVFPLKT